MKYYKHSIVAIVAMNLFFLAFLYFAVIDGWNSLEYKNSPFPTDKKAYHPGDPVGISRLICNDKRYNFTSHIAIVDGFVVQLAPINGTFTDTGCRAKTDMSVTIPRFLPPGEYKLTGITTVHVNPIRDHSVEWETTSFMVIK